METLSHARALQLVSDFGISRGSKDETYSVSARNKNMTVRVTIKKDGKHKSFTRSCVASKFKDGASFEIEILEALCKKANKYKSGKTEDSDKDSDEDSDEEYKSTEDKENGTFH